MAAFCSPRHSVEMFLSLHFVFLSLAFVDSTPNIKDCITSNGSEYRGEERSSSSGLTCLVWTNTSRDYDVKTYTDAETGVGEHNFCRNPDSSASPWCYISGPDGTVQRQSCAVETCEEQPTGVAAEAPTAGTRVFESTESGSNRAEVPAVQPVMGISQRVRTSPKKKKDLGTTGYVLGIAMMAIIILLGAGITVGYFFKRGQDLRKKHEQHVYEREMQRITLPLSAFTNPTCELIDENTIVITAEQDPTPVQEDGDPLIIQQAGTPGA